MKKKKQKTKSSNSKKPVKSMRGVPENYDEVKKQYSICFTPTVHKKLKCLAREKNLSMSEFIEQIIRKFY